VVWLRDFPLDHAAMSQLSKCAAALAATAALAACLAAFSAQASESGVSFYLLGTGGPGAAVMPPIEGVFLSNTAYYYHGSTDADRQFPIGGAVVAGVKASIAADFATVLWVPSTDFLGGTVGLGGRRVSRRRTRQPRLSPLGQRHLRRGELA